MPSIKLSYRSLSIPFRCVSSLPLLDFSTKKAKSRQYIHVSYNENETIHLCCCSDSNRCWYRTHNFFVLQHFFALMSGEVKYTTAQDEVLRESVKQIQSKFPTATELVNYYSKTFFHRLPPIPYLFPFNDDFFGFSHTCNDPVIALEWLKRPSFEKGMAAHAKLPDKSYLSGFHPFAFQYQAPESLDTKDFDTLQKFQENTTQTLCDAYNNNFKEKNKIDTDKMAKCKKCKVGTLQYREERTRLGADEAATPVTKCLNCGDRIKI